MRVFSIGILCCDTSELFGFHFYIYNVIQFVFESIVFALTGWFPQPDLPLSLQLFLKYMIFTCFRMINVNFTFSDFPNGSCMKVMSSRLPQVKSLCWYFSCSNIFNASNNSLFLAIIYLHYFSVIYAKIKSQADQCDIGFFKYISFPSSCSIVTVSASYAFKCRKFFFPVNRFGRFDSSSSHASYIVFFFFSGLPRPESSLQCIGTFYIILSVKNLIHFILDTSAQSSEVIPPSLSM